jgi:hypothetical protein
MRALEMAEKILQDTCADAPVAVGKVCSTDFVSRKF